MARELYGEGTDEARRWVESLIHQLRHGQELPVIQTRRDLIAVVRDAKARTVVERETQYLETHRDPIHYGAYEQAGYPLGSGAMESTCKQFHTRFKRAGQFWTEPGDEKILCLCADRMSGRWQELRPHLEAA